MRDYQKSPMPHELKNGAIILTDAHYPRHKEELLALFDSFLATPPPQLILLGDMFEFLTPYLPYSLTFNQELIEKIKELSKKTELFYLEGNHDFLLAPLFPDAKVYTLGQQPVIFEANGKKIAMMHGDKHERLRYRIYAKLIRNNSLILLLRVFTLDVGGRYAKKLYKKLLAKNICTKFESFTDKKMNQLHIYDLDGIDILIEGHYHKRLTMDFQSTRYEAFDAFACNKSFFEVEFSDSDISFKRNEF